MVLKERFCMGSDKCKTVPLGTRAVGIKSVWINISLAASATQCKMCAGLVAQLNYSSFLSLRWNTCLFFSKAVKGIYVSLFIKNNFPLDLWLKLTFRPSLTPSKPSGFLLVCCSMDKCTCQNLSTFRRWWCWLNVWAVFKSVKCVLQTMARNAPPSFPLKWSTCPLLIKQTS